MLNMKRIIILIALSVTARLWSDEPLQEHVEVVGRFFAAEPNSKNILIVDRRQIEQSRAPSIAALLNQLPALNVSRRGADDSSFDLSMRGSHFEQIQVLVNGIPFNNPQTGHFNTDFPFSLQDIERIEIIRGGNSTGFGAGAFAGVINFVLKTDSRSRLGITAGEKDYRSLYVATGHEFGRFSLSASLRRQTADGFYLGREFDQTQALLHLQYKKNDFYSELQGGWLDKSFGAAGFYAPYPSWEQIRSGYYALRLGNSGPKWQYQLYQAFVNHDDYFLLDRYRPNWYVGDHVTKQILAGFFLNTASGPWIIHAGADSQWENMDSRSMGNHDRQRGSLHARLEWTAPVAGKQPSPFGFDGGMRIDFVSKNSAALTWRVGVFHWLSPALQLKGGYGVSLRYPSFTELYYQTPGNFGDPALLPERSRNAEISLTAFSARRAISWSGDLTFFYRRQLQTIDWVRQTPESPWQVVNIASNDIAGCETVQHWQIAATTIGAGMERLWVINDQTRFESKYSLRFPDQRYFFSLQQSLLSWLTGNITYQYKHIYKTSFSGHFCDVVLTAALGKWRVSLRAENIFDTRIEEIPGVKISGRWVYLSLTM
jgi:iron complex outermembrane receptor protein